MNDFVTLGKTGQKKKKKKKKKKKCSQSVNLIKSLFVCYLFLIGFVCCLKGGSVIYDNGSFCIFRSLKAYLFTLRVQYNIDCCAQLIHFAGRLYSLFCFILFFPSRFFATALKIVTNNFAPVPACLFFFQLSSTLYTLFVVLFPNLPLFAFYRKFYPLSHNHLRASI